MRLVCHLITTYDDVQFGLELLKHFTFFKYILYTILCTCLIRPTQTVDFVYEMKTICVDPIKVLWFVVWVVFPLVILHLIKQFYKTTIRWRERLGMELKVKARTQEISQIGEQSRSTGLYIAPVDVVSQAATQRCRRVNGRGRRLM